MQKHHGSSAQRVPDELIVEEPMEIRLDDHLVTTTMRTPGHDYELAAGFLFTDGRLAGAPVEDVRYCAHRLGRGQRIQRRVGRAPAAGRHVPTPRLTTTTSSCGLCGSASLADLAERLVPLRDAAADPARRAGEGGRPRGAGAGPVRRDRRRARGGRLRPGRVSRCSSARTSGGTTRSTRWSGASCSTARLPAERPRPVRERPGQLRDRAEGVGGGVRGGASR